MKQNKVWILIIAMFALVQIVLATPNSMNIQGKLTSNGGSILAGTYNFTFRIYDNSTAGSMLYETNLSLTTDSRGVYDAILTNINLPFNKQYYLAVKVMSDSEMQPRVNLTSVPYSFKANESEGLNTSKDATVNGNVNISASGNINALGTITGDVLNSISQLNVAGGFSNGGLTIQSNGDIVTYGDVLFSGNISVVNVTYLSVNGTITPGLDATFDVGNGSLRWRNGNFSGRVESSSLTVGSAFNVQAGAITANMGSGAFTINGDGGSGRLTINQGASGLGLYMSNGYILLNGGKISTGTDGVQSRMLLEAGIADGATAVGFLLNQTTALSTSGAKLFELRESDSAVFTIDHAGNVGIGTTVPNYLLQTASGTDGRSVNLSNVLYVNGSSGRVGIGTAIPTSTLHVNATGTNGGFRITNDSGYTAFFVNSTSGLVGVGATNFNNAKFEIRGVGGNGTASISLNADDPSSARTTIEHAYQGAAKYTWYVWSDAGSLRLYDHAFSSDIILFNKGGTIGVNVSPTQTLDILGTFSVRSGQSGNAQGLYQNPSGNVGIGTTSPTSTLHVIGTGNFSGNLYAGSCTNQTSPLNQTCTDIAELFAVEKGVSSGDVVCLKENGKAGHCDKAFDSKILGVISTNPAIIIEGDNIVLGRGQYSDKEKMPIALKGKVPVKVDCKVPIKQGDLLVAADKKGYAMKLNLDEINWKQSIGTVFGKALEDCKNGEKMIMAWVG